MKEPVPFAVQVLRRFNPLIVAILRSPLHGLLSANILVLTYRGRRSGKSYTLPISYVTIGERVYLCTRTTAWWRNLRDGREVQVRLRGEELTMKPTLLEPDSPEALDGLRRFLTVNPGTGETLYHVRRGENGKPNEEDLRREVRRSIVVRLER